MTCNTEGCDKKLRSDNRSGHCKGHYVRVVVRRVVEPCQNCGKEKSRGRGRRFCDGCEEQRKICSHKDCDTPNTHGGLCGMHHHRKKKGLDMDAPLHYAGRIEADKICARESCETIVIGRSNQLYCSVYCRRKNSTWRKDNPERSNNITRRRRVITRGGEATLTPQEWEAILETFNYECVYCGAPWEQQDHFIPVYSGGTHTADNVVPSCAPCNQRKNRQDPLKFIGCGLYVEAR